ncbi:hypothetical protein CDD81_3046 [Ophiocordyceps australis]|uniref:Uncharacterized protein n=1 Tax=Ophiocordyceps australis TaxID=1399860 RepID=A0A2C5YEX5_9HYPO|nr:hypothetical protein CDD81_3046 [Ophiocordyceps australis]
MARPSPSLFAMGTIPESPVVSRRPTHMDEADELAGDTWPACSPSFWRGGESIRLPTMTFLSGRTTRDSQCTSSPPQSPSRSSVVEVPASSSPQTHREEATRLGARLAPAGTFFRPPASMPSKKRPHTQHVNLVSDEEDEASLPLRDSPEPTSFHSRVAAFAYSPEREMRNKLRQVYDVVGGKYPSELVREALRVCQSDIEDAIAWLAQHGSVQGNNQANKDGFKGPISCTQQPPPSLYGTARQHGKVLQPRKSPMANRLMTASPSGGSLQPNSSLSASPSPRKPTRRRLVQGVKRRSVPSPQTSSPTPSRHGLLGGDNDKDDAYQVDEPATLLQEDVDRVLACLNTSTLKELAAMTSLKEQVIEPLFAKRPFDTLAQARKICITNKTRARKTARVSVGETVVDAIEVFLDAISAIDKVVADCEAKAQTIKSIIDGWELDCSGHSKRSQRPSPDRDMPPTPSSVASSTGYVPCPVPQQPERMDGHCVMKPFQLFGLNWMSLLYHNDIGCILADEMGLGKTCQVISLICHLVQDYEQQRRCRRPWPNLIVVPPSTYNNWLMELERFAPHLSVVGYRGTQAERAAIAYQVEEEPEAYHVVLATYSQINSDQDVECMRSLDLNAAIFDEGHKMKNPETKIYKDLKRITAHWKMLLTGTPVQNNLMEMTALLSFINPQMFDGCMRHIKYIFSHKISIRDVSNGAFLYKERVKRARTILEPFILQRRKDQVLSDMPPKVNAVVHCPMSERQKPVYDEYEAIFRLEPGQRTKQVGGRHNDLNNVWMQLRKAALHPLLFRRHFDDAKVEAMAKVLMREVPQSELHQTDLKHLVQELKNSSDFELHLWCRDYAKHLAKFDIAASCLMESGKVTKLLQLIGQYQEEGDRVLVFSKFSRLIELLIEVLSLQNIEHRVLMGNTNVSERQTLIDDFNDNPAIPVFLLTTGAGGTGINLTAANKVIIFDQSDNPQDDIQAENRAHRLGQTRPVEVVRLISSATIEELVYKACQKKIELANKVTGTSLESSEEQDEENMETKVRNMIKDMTPP